MPLRLSLTALAAVCVACSGESPPSSSPVTPSDETVREPSLPDGMQIDAPAPNAEIRTPLKLSGSVPGPWYFEGSFPIELRTNDGRVLAESIAQSTGNWMTTDPVGFTGALDFEVDTPTAAVLVLHEDNTSGQKDARRARLPLRLMPSRPN